MAVTDHPLYPEFSEAFDSLVKAKEKLDAVRHLENTNPNSLELQQARSAYGLALHAYHTITDRL